MIHDLNELARTGRVLNEALALLEGDRKRLGQVLAKPARQLDPYERRFTRRLQDAFRRMRPESGAAVPQT
ncbi:hypothetical protein [Streptomyces mirabilis]|uniref:hypothetical protein n=1 Tax=Streptomyces mirabilis TaxID=68239 RepID=UPI000765E51F|nr:hypothetical protein [Streptomyces mirabilis]MCX4428388.1 hypothetical protein [Streptomyces mirabilis]